MYYILNMETLKLELHFEKSEYLAMPEQQKSEIKSNFLFSRAAGAWVSRSKYPNTHYAETVCKKLGAENHGRTGEKLSFEEQQERKAERAEARADRYEGYAENAQKRSESLCKPYNDHHGDIAFFTQPNINTSAGRAFTRSRQRVFDAFDRGMEELKKSEYFRERAETARNTAAYAKPTDKGFCQRRIDEAAASIRKLEKSVRTYETIIEHLNSGKPETWYSKEERYWIEDSRHTVEQCEKNIERWEELAEMELSKLAYYQSCIDEIGGVTYSKENIKPGYIVKIDRYSGVEVVSCGPKNFTYRIISGGAAGMVLKASYAEILEVVKAEEQNKEESPKHPFKAGEELSFSLVDGRNAKLYTIVSATEKTVTIDKDGKKVRRTPAIYESWDGKRYWRIAVDDYHVHNRLVTA